MALVAIEWAAREFVDGRAPDWAALESDWLDDATEDNHDCTSVGIGRTLHDLERASLSLAAFTQTLTDSDLDIVQDYGSGLFITTGTVIRHALHDAEHHVLDVRRGLARLLLAS